MKYICRTIIIILAIICINNLVDSKSARAAELIEHPYIDFSSDRSTWFFKTGEDNNIAFFDFFFPFDPTGKMKAYDPLTMYEFEHTYYFGDQGTLMIHLDDLKKMYDPYFDYTITDDQLYIRHTVYEKLITNGYGERSTTLEYKKKVWDLHLPFTYEQDINTGIYEYKEYLPVIGGRNKPDITPSELNIQKSVIDQPFTFSKGSIEIKDGEYYVPLAEIMELMGKVTWEDEGYLAVQDKEMPDVTQTINRDKSHKIEPVTIPNQSNIWNSGSFEDSDPTYTWADYMNDVADGVRKTGWLWKSFYVSSGNHFKDENGQEISLEANRIVPYSLYIPNDYDPNETRMVTMLHGGTGNEHTPTSRLIQNDLRIEQYAEEFNYILLSPNGWTQNPLWRQNQGLYAFEQSLNEALAEFPVQRDRLFLTGNSLGGRGTLEIASRFPDQFRAIVPTAPKIVERDSKGNTKINIVGTNYDLSAIKDTPTLVMQGTADTTTSFKVQIGNENQPGAIVSSIMPKLENAEYMTIEQGDHTYSYGSALKTIFDFFEEQLSPSLNHNIDKLTLYNESKQIQIDKKDATLSLATTDVNGVTMISLSDLEDIYGESFKVYPIHLYNSDAKDKPDFWTILYNGHSINFKLEENIYRIGMERYKEDVLTSSNSSSPSDISELSVAPTFLTAPFEYEGQVFIPAEEVLSVLGLNVSIEEHSFFEKYRTIMYTAGLGILFLGIAIYISRRYKK